VNRLAGETSPYLRQHQDNPVDWFGWGAEALAHARERDVPLFVSIGYSACHWCHVMAHESFEDQETADYLNEHFVSVKVDREERPDIDAIYMEAVQAINDGRGGWPLTVFATPEGRPFFGGTYFPDTARHGSPSFREVLRAVSDAWRSDRDKLEAQADDLTGAVGSRLAPPPMAEELGADPLLDSALERVRAIFDPEHGGLGRAPKFPQAPILDLLLQAHLAGRAGALDMALSSLRAMAAGGIYDHLGGGFARYATDRAWQIPHFEKMLYDQAMIAKVLLHAWQVTGEDELRQVLDETIGFVLSELRDPAGGIYCALDADSEGVEGRFYTWTPDQLRAALGADGASAALGADGVELAASWYGVTSSGNFEDGQSILHRPLGAPLRRPPEIEQLRRELLAARSKRIPPGTDDKVLTEWNAMFGAVLVEAGAATGEQTWIDAGIAIGEFLVASLRREDGRWLRSWQGGRASTLAVGADYAWLVELFTRLGEATGEARFTAIAVETAEQMISLFSAGDGGWYMTGHDAERLVVRPRDAYDGVTPSASSVAAVALARLGALTGNHVFSERARASVEAAGEALARSPLAFPTLVSAALLIERGIVEIVVAQSGDRSLVDVVHGRWLPDVVLAWGEPSPGPLWEGRDDPDDRRAYVCVGSTCLAPVTEPDELVEAMNEARRSLGQPGSAP